MGPAAILSILVKASGVKATSAELTALNASGKSAATGLAATETAARRAGGAHLKAAKAVAGFVGAYAAVSTLSKSEHTVMDLGKTTLTLSKNFGLATKTAGEWAAVSTARGTEGKALTMGFKALSTQTKNARDAINGTGAATKALGQKQALAVKQAEAEGKSSKDIAQLKEKQALAMSQLAGKSAAGAKAFALLGIGQKELTKHGDDLNWVLNHVSDGLKALPAGTNKAAIQAKLFGRTWLALSPVIRDGSKNLQEQLKTADKYGATLSGKTVKAVQEHIKATREQKLATIGLQVAIGSVLMPILSKVQVALTGLIYGFRNSTGAGGALRNAVDKVVAALTPFGVSIKTIVGWLTKHKDVANVLLPVLGGLALAIWAVNAALDANPFVLAAVALAALTIGIVTAYRESKTFRDIVDAVFGTIGPLVTSAMTAIVPAVKTAFTAIVQAAGWVQTAFTNVVTWVSTAMDSVSTEIGKWGPAATVVKTALTVITTAVGPAFAIIAGVIRVQMAIATAILSAAWGVIQAIFSGAWIAIKGIVSGGLTALGGVVKIFGGILKGDFGQVWDGVQDIFRGAFRALKGIFTGEVHTFASAATAIGDAIGGAFTKAFDAVKDTVVGFINAIIDIINKIPGVHIGHVGGGSKSTGPGNVDLSKSTGALARGGAFGMTGGTVNKPMVMMGEEAPRWPEYVIPTNPAYRNRAQGLLAQASGAIGMADGGVIGKVTGAVGDAGGAVGGLVAGGAKALLGKLPDTGKLPGWLKDTGHIVLEKAGGYIKDKVGSLIAAAGSALGVGGGSQATSTKGLVPRVLKALSFARAHGWKGAVSSGFRSDAEQVSIWNRGIRPAAKPKSLGGPGSNHSLGQAVDVSDIPGFQRAMDMMPAGERLYARVPNDPVHFSVTGNKMGGIIRALSQPYVGAYQNGGLVPETGLAMMHKGELVLPMKKGAANSQGGNVKAVWQFLLSNGFTPAQAAGIIGVMQGESGQGLSTTATNPKSKAYGIAQWLGKRKTALMNKKDPSSLATQLKFLMSELKGSESGAMSKIKGAHSIDAAVSAWLYGFERPGKGEANVAGRTANAKSVFAALKGVKGKGGASNKAPEDVVSNYEMISALADTAITQAQATPKLGDDVLANTQLRDATTFRIKQVRAALKKQSLKPSTRLRLTQELGSLVGKHTELQGTLKDLRAQPANDFIQAGLDSADARLSAAQTTESLTDDLGPLQDKANILAKVFDATQKKFGAGSLEAQTAFANLAQATKTLADTQREAVFQPYRALLKGGNAALIRAQVDTPGILTDDLGALQGSLDTATTAYNDAVAHGDTDAIIEFGGEVITLRDAIKNLSTTIDANTQAMLDLQKQLTDEAQKKYNVSQSDYAVLSKAIASVASGEIGGRVGLGFMSPSFPGGGSSY